MATSATGPATVMEQLVTLPCPPAAVWWRGDGQKGDGMDRIKRGRTFPPVADVSVAAGRTTGQFVLPLQAGRSLPGADNVSHHDLSKNPCSGIFNPSPFCGGEWEEAQLSSHCEVLQMLVLQPFSHSLPLPTS